jgi:hypothetical protein
VSPEYRRQKMYDAVANEDVNQLLSFGKKPGDLQKGTCKQKVKNQLIGFLGFSNPFLQFYAKRFNSD